MTVNLSSGFSLTAEGRRAARRTSRTRKPSLGMRRRSSSELFSLTRRRSSLDVVTEKEVALFTERKLSTALSPAHQDDQNSPIMETTSLHDSHPTETQAEHTTEILITDRKTSEEIQENDASHGKVTETMDHRAHEDLVKIKRMDAFDNAAFQADISVSVSSNHEERQDISDSPCQMGSTLKRTPSEESRLQRKGARYFNRKARASEGVIQSLQPIDTQPVPVAQSAPTTESCANPFFPTTSPSTSSSSKQPNTKPQSVDRARKFTYDIAMGVISMDSWSQMIDEHETKKLKKAGKERKDKNSKPGMKSYLHVGPTLKHQLHSPYS